MSATELPHEVTAEQRIDAPPDAVWAALRRLEGVATSAAVIHGHRRFERDGEVYQRLSLSPSVWVEHKMVWRDDAARAHRFRYSGGQGVPWTDHEVEARVEPDGGGSVVRLSCRFASPERDAPSVTGMLRGLLILGLANLQRLAESGGFAGER